MRRALLSLILLVFINFVKGIEIPLSKQAVLEDRNLISDFVRVDPDDSNPETLLTKAWLWQDEDNLFIHFSCIIDESFIPGYPANRDEGIKADNVRVQLATLPDDYFAYTFLAYPCGHLIDGIRREDMSIDYKWDSKYSYQSSYNDSTWSVTFTIPLGALRFKNSLPYRWKVILSRYNYTNRENFSSPYASIKQKRDYFKSMHEIILTHPVKRDQNIVFKPYFVKNYDLLNKTESFDPDMVGLDITLNPSQQTRIKVSLNPDFSDVPPDNAQDIYNTDVPVLYEESRFFFTEDIDAFGLDSTVFHSRNINKPSFAFKGTGKIGTTKWGLLGALDKGLVQDGAIINYDDYFHVLSLISDFSNISLGNATVSRVNKGYYNHLYNGNYQFQFNNYLNLQTKVIGSIRKDSYAVDRSLKKGYQVTCNVNYYPGGFDNTLTYQRTSKDIFAEAGHLFYKDRQSYGISSSWNPKPRYGFIKQTRSFLSLDVSDWFHDSGIDTEYAIYGTFAIEFKPEIQNSLKAAYGSIYDDYHKEHKYYEAYNTLSFNRWIEFNLSFTLRRAHTMIYALNDTYDLNNLTTYLSGTIERNYYYSFQWSLMDYQYPKENVLDYGNGPVTVNLDNQYSVINAKLQYTPNLSLRFTTGLTYSSYESQGVYSQLSYYANLRYEFKRDYYIYVGYKSAQTQDAASTNSDYFGHFIKNSASIYFKVSVSL